MTYEILFSATGRSEKVLKIISDNFEGPKERIDLSNPNLDVKKYNINKDDLCIICVSVYMGRVPFPAVENLKKLNGNDSRAILISVFGNRNIDDCLLELKNICIDRNFKPIAAIESVAEHSIFTKYANSRPDNKDKEELIEFSKNIKNLLLINDFGDVCVPGNFPYKKYKSLPLKPKTNKNCINCKICATNCPTGAISLNNPKITDNNKCISCMKCVEICPKDARNMPKYLTNIAQFMMKPMFNKRKENKLYLAK